MLYSVYPAFEMLQIGLNAEKKVKVIDLSPCFVMLLLSLL